MHEQQRKAKKGNPTVEKQSKKKRRVREKNDAMVRVNEEEGIVLL